MLLDNLGSRPFALISRTMFMVTPTTKEGIEDAQRKHGAAAGGKICMQNENTAAAEAIESGMYVTWIPMEGAPLPSTASDELRDGLGQCCRVRSDASCFCGHTLSSHAPVPLSARATFIKPPKCIVARCSCRCFNYAPDRPEECGQWWLPRRKDFNIAEWRKRLRQNPGEYVCIGCDTKVSDHETQFETRAMRVRRGAAVDENFRPLADFEAREDVLDETLASTGMTRR